MGSTAASFDLDNIQGDIWPGLLKRYQKFIFFTIDNATTFKPMLKRLVDDEVITTANDALKDRVAISKVAQAQKGKPSKPGIVGSFLSLTETTIKSIHDLLPEHDHIQRAQGSSDIALARSNIAFTNKGMAKLNKDLLFKDDPFLKGMYADLHGEGRDREEQWLSAFKSDSVDGVIHIAGTKHEVEEKAKHLVESYLGQKSIVTTIEGKERCGAEGHEHFGYLDGVSQPLLKGLDDEAAAKPGAIPQRTRPGIILFGHDGEMDNEPRLMHPPWAKDGSIMVFRKIKQLVPEFDRFLEAEAPKLHLTADQLGARIVGRWKSGAPVQLHPWEDPVAKETDPAKKKELATWNNIEYPTQDQFNCPFASHMRKTKPRSVIDNDDKFDIMRRGIPYGEEMDVDEKKGTKSQKDRGLLFVCYQTSLSNGFQFIKNRWINPDTFPAGKKKFTGGKYPPGQDALIGQSLKNPIDEDDKLLHIMVYDDHDKEHKRITFDPWIEAQGGDYFFTPSLDLLRKLGASA
ncbi:hypothetical protein N7509_007885 [Penicillium cosmopolitanum]|uniref:Dyp-type peroxidase n=1 Tax=Penicillium cosmopolitanum TaxID=1131564 RepID=A0A9W9VZX3_9EURO|nr:uncharacterized protein N7509_007885 [Penicillium cosmopolitanum]KAJ5392395.1 hypothetical protein N7509_007885 [Penicillium cosmopolitanum]